MEAFRHHVYICDQKKPEGAPSCPANGSALVIEALRAEVDYFVRCLEKNEEPFNNGQTGLQVVRLLEAADKSIKNNGRRIEL